MNCSYLGASGPAIWLIRRFEPDSEKTYGNSDTRSSAFIRPDRVGVAAAAQSEISVVFSEFGESVDLTLSRPGDG